LLRSTQEKVSQLGDTVVFECLSHPASRGSSAQLRVDWLKDGQPIATGLQSPDPHGSQTIAADAQSSPPKDSRPIADDDSQQGGQRDVQSQPRRRRRHFLIADSQILVLLGTRPSDAGVYTCIVSNAVGSQRAVTKLRVTDGPLTSPDNDDPDPDPAAGDDGEDMLTVRVGLAVIAAVCGVVLTSLAWVLIIYCLQRRHDLIADSTSSTSTDETIIPTAAAAAASDTLDSLRHCLHLTPGTSLNSVSFSHQNFQGF